MSIQTLNLNFLSKKESEAARIYPTCSITGQSSLSANESQAPSQVSESKHRFLGRLGIVRRYGRSAAHTLMLLPFERTYNDSTTLSLLRRSLSLAFSLKIDDTSDCRLCCHEARLKLPLLYIVRCDGLRNGGIGFETLLCGLIVVRVTLSRRNRTVGCDRLCLVSSVVTR